MEDSTKIFDRKSTILFGLVILLAIAVRWGVLAATPGALETDPDGYRRLAQNLIEHGTFGSGDQPTAFRPPLYPLLLTGCVALGDYQREAIGALHVVIGAATVGLVLLLGRWWGLGRWGATLAALLVACDPILLAQSTQVMTETPAAFLATAGLVILTWASCKTQSSILVGCGAMLSAGAILALAALDRASLMLWIPAIGAFLFYRRGSVGRWCFPAAFFIAAVVVLSPWAIRNQREFGRPIVTTTHGGYTLLLANNPEFYAWLREGGWGDVWRADAFNAAWDRRRPSGEIEADRAAYAEAWQNIRSQPGMFAYACMVRLGRFWSPMPHRVVDVESASRRLARWAVAAWYAAEFILAAVGVTLLFRRKALSEPWIYGLLLVLCLTAVHAFFWTDMRMRAPIMPVVALAASFGAVEILRKSKAQRKSQ